MFLFSCEYNVKLTGNSLSNFDIGIYIFFAFNVMQSTYFKIRGLRVFLMSILSVFI